MKKGEIKQGLNNESYELVKKLGRGGQAQVWSVKSLSDGKMYAYKHYTQDKNGVRSNIEDLIKIGQFKDSNGNPVDSVVLPITIVEGDGDSFGYIMDLVNLDDYTNLKKAWSGGEYPSCRALCHIVQNLAVVFKTFHLSYGMCYKDVNEGNIFFNPKTGDVKIIDNDNVGYSDKFTIKGTSGYMAPEVVLGDRPDHKSDRFSFAVYVYRLLIGGYPFEGPYTDDYCRQNDILSDDARKVIFGSAPIFVWNPNDKRNCIDKRKDPQSQGQTELWHSLPKEIQDLFIKTFVTNLSKSRCAERATDQDWYDVFEKLEQGLVTCPHCQQETFGSSQKCFLCGKKLPGKATGKSFPKPIFKPKKVPNQQTKTQSSSSSGHSHKAVLTILSMGEAKRNETFAVSDCANGENISKNLPVGPLFKVLYNKDQRKIGLKNLGSIPWQVHYTDASGNKVVRTCGYGQILELRKGMRIQIIKKVAHLNVEELI